MINSVNHFNFLQPITLPPENWFQQLLNEGDELKCLAYLQSSGINPLKIKVSDAEDSVK